MKPDDFARLHPETMDAVSIPHVEGQIPSYDDPGEAVLSFSLDPELAEQLKDLEETLLRTPSASLGSKLVIAHLKRFRSLVNSAAVAEYVARTFIPRLLVETNIYIDQGALQVECYKWLVFLIRKGASVDTILDFFGRAIEGSANYSIFLVTNNATPQYLTAYFKLLAELKAQGANPSKIKELLGQKDRAGRNVEDLLITAEAGWLFPEYEYSAGLTFSESITEYINLLKLLDPELDVAAKRKEINLSIVSSSVCGISKFYSSRKLKLRTTPIKLLVPKLRRMLAEEELQPILLILLEEKIQAGGNIDIEDFEFLAVESDLKSCFEYLKTVSKHYYIGNIGNLERFLRAGAGLEAILNELEKRLSEIRRDPRRYGNSPRTQFSSCISTLLKLASLGPSIAFQVFWLLSQEERVNRLVVFDEETVELSVITNVLSCLEGENLLRLLTLFIKLAKQQVSVEAIQAILAKKPPILEEEEASTLAYKIVDLINCGHVRDFEVLVKHSLLPAISLGLFNQTELGHFIPHAEIFIKYFESLPEEQQYSLYLQALVKNGPLCDYFKLVEVQHRDRLKVGLAKYCDKLIEDIQRRRFNETELNQLTELKDELCRYIINISNDDEAISLLRAALVEGSLRKYFAIPRVLPVVEAKSCLELLTLELSARQNKFLSETDPRRRDPLFLMETEMTLFPPARREVSSANTGEGVRELPDASLNQVQPRSLS